MKSYSPLNNQLQIVTVYRRTFKLDIRGSAKMQRDPVSATQSTATFWRRSKDYGRIVLHTTWPSEPDQSRDNESQSECSSPSKLLFKCLPPIPHPHWLLHHSLQLFPYPNDQLLGERLTYSWRPLLHEDWTLQWLRHKSFKRNANTPVNAPLNGNVVKPM